MNKNTGEKLLVNGKEVTSEVTFKAESSSGDVDVSFTFDSIDLSNESIVVFEELYFEDKLIAEHKDINDMGQTIIFESSEEPSEPTNPTAPTEPSEPTNPTAPTTPTIPTYSGTPNKGTVNTGTFSMIGLISALIVSGLGISFVKRKIKEER